MYSIYFFCLFFSSIVGHPGTLLPPTDHKSYCVSGDGLFLHPLLPFTAGLVTLGRGRESCCLFNWGDGLLVFSDCWPFVTCCCTPNRCTTASRNTELSLKLLTNVGTSTVLEEDFLWHGSRGIEQARQRIRDFVLYLARLNPDLRGAGLG